MKLRVNEPSKTTLTIIAGPNGSGKSTFTRATQEALRVLSGLILQHKSGSCSRPLALLS